jgi:hypothetical protein
MMFGWDAYVVPSSGKYIVHISHHGFFEICARCGDDLKAIARRFAPWQHGGGSEIADLS